MYVCVYVKIYARMYVCMYVCMYVRICIYMCIHTYIYIHIYIYLHMRVYVLPKIHYTICEISSSHTSKIYIYVRSLWVNREPISADRLHRAAEGCRHEALLRKDRRVRKPEFRALSQFRDWEHQISYVCTYPCM